MKRYRDRKTDQLGDALSQQLKQQLDRPPLTEEELFSFAQFNAAEAERGGYSNYSYWMATIRAFFHNKVAVFFLIVMVALLVFTFIQPLLPGQMDPLTTTTMAVCCKTSSPVSRAISSAPISWAKMFGPVSGPAPAPPCSSVSP